MSQITQLLISHGGLFLFLTAFADQSGLPFPAVPWLLAAGALAARPIRHPTKARHPDWVLIATLTFMVFCWIAFVFSICVIWVKCGGSSPF